MLPQLLSEIQIQQDYDQEGVFDIRRNVVLQDQSILVVKRYNFSNLSRWKLDAVMLVYHTSQVYEIQFP